MFLWILAALATIVAGLITHWEPRSLLIFGLVCTIIGGLVTYLEMKK
jgi:hypothetical protein